MAHYNTPERVLQTLALAEQQGINTLVFIPPDQPAIPGLLKRHREKHGGKMQWIIAPMNPIEPGLARYGEQVQSSWTTGPTPSTSGASRPTPWRARGKIELVGKAVDLIRAHGVPCGVAAHDLRVVQQCEKNRIPADFYIKTFHHHKYPSAHAAGHGGGDGKA